MTKLLALLLACAMLLGCSPTTVFEPLTSETTAPTPEEPESSSLLRLPVNLQDGLNPFKISTQINQSLVPLLYDGLFRLSPDYQAEPLLASEAMAEGAAWRVTLRPDAVFSDGTPVTAQDVVYSFYQAAAASSPYAEQLRQVQACYAQEGAVVFALDRPNSLFARNLTFPIVKADTGGRDRPIGSGRFVVSTADSSGMTLIPGREPQRCGPVTEVRLVAMTDDFMTASSLKVGTIDLLLATRSEREKALAGVDSQSVDLNALNFLAINPTSETLSDPAVRRAIYLAINREELAQWSYGSKAEAAYTPFNPRLDWLPDAEFVGRDGLARAIALLEEAGYTPEGKDGRLSFVLLVNADSDVRLAAAYRLQEQLARAGFSLRVDEQPYESFLAAYQNGRYDLCLGEQQIADDMTLDLLLPGIAQNYGELSAAYIRFMADHNEADGFIAQFLEQNPLIPLVYRYGTLASARNFNTSLVATKWDIFYNMSEW